MVELDTMTLTINFVGHDDEKDVCVTRLHKLAECCGVLPNSANETRGPDFANQNGGFWSFEFTGPAGSLRVFLQGLEATEDPAYSGPLFQME